MAASLIDQIAASRSSIVGRITVADIYALVGATNTVTNPADGYTASNGDVILVNVAAGEKTINLPDAATSTNYRVQVKNTTFGNNSMRVMVSPFGSQTIDDETVIEIKAPDSLVFICNGTDWFITS